MKADDTRRRIVEAADRLFYERGFETTSFADIAQAVALSRGNFYYHFKTKDEILSEVIECRIAERRQLLSRWDEQETNPRLRIENFINILIVNQTKIMAFGCPVGTLCTELAKLDHALQGEAARLFQLFAGWLEKQFAQLGCGSASHDLAMHLLMRSQGVATLANTFRDADFVRREVDAMIFWLNTQIPDATSCS
ncbi:Toluene efflux pump ttgABC operon repressor [Hartmannibacter diazotrophicus]|uniref:Toluene efflux pump ttgABC operon repressor n=1 Tax=Hartmannibacter diazotrophicus TaxID=1482074 RepID=A0A2C9D0X4_9HYPH|nr:TetR/AcrR family transcriptional regulator [Hartmannibacter diazotrophicus]SON53873.1 Toluene efflux pump ttgABC operon repressor [Hartmannibacter diazotrophicus]